MCCTWERSQEEVFLVCTGMQGTTQQITIVNTVSQLFRVHSAKLSQGPKLLKGHRTGKVLAEHTLSFRNVFDFIQE